MVITSFYDVVEKMIDQNIRVGAVCLSRENTVRVNLVRRRDERAALFKGVHATDCYDRDRPVHICRIRLLKEIDRRNNRWVFATMNARSDNKMWTVLRTLDRSDRKADRVSIRSFIFKNFRFLTAHDFPP